MIGYWMHSTDCIPVEIFHTSHQVKVRLCLLFPISQQVGGWFFLLERHKSQLALGKVVKCPIFHPTISHRIPKPLQSDLELVRVTVYSQNTSPRLASSLSYNKRSWHHLKSGIDQRTQPPSQFIIRKRSMMMRIDRKISAANL